MSRGVGRFERLLEPFGLSGSVDAETRKILFEMHELRNVIAHRRALADRKFVTSVPWAKYKIGQPIKVTSGDVHRYHGAIANYVTVIIQRFTELMKERAK
jgi:NADPH-dependent 2,4-dienoyl-CoA reductase/sulfur reductase-like enzyme